MRRDILIILACLSIGFAIIGCGPIGSTIMEEVFLRELEVTAEEAAIDVTKDAILPKAKGKFKGVKLGMTRAKVKSIIEKKKSLTPVECPVEGIDQAKTVMWDSEIWIVFRYHEGKLIQIQFGTEEVSEDLIETKLRKQFKNLYYYFYKKVGEPDYYREGFSMKEITVSSFEGVPYTPIYRWVNGNTERRLWLWGKDGKYCTFATISNRKVVMKLLEEKNETKN